MAPDPGDGNVLVLPLSQGLFIFLSMSDLGGAPLLMLIAVRRAVWESVRRNSMSAVFCVAPSQIALFLGWSKNPSSSQ